MSFISIGGAVTASGTLISSQSSQVTKWISTPTNAYVDVSLLEHLNQGDRRGKKEKTDEDETKVDGENIGENVGGNLGENFGENIGENVGGNKM